MKYVATTKKEFERIFKAEELPAIQERYEKDGRVDVHARRQTWNDHIDMLVKEGALPEKAMNWSCPW